MKGLKTLNCWCLLIAVGLLMIQQIDLTSAYSMEETCKYINEGWIADPTDCQSYGYCQNLELKGKSKCPSGAYYNPDRGVCQYQKACRFNVGIMCQGKPDLTVFPHPSNCSQYIVCLQGVDNVQDCPGIQIYDSIQGQCVWPQSAKSTCPDKSICRLVQDNVFAADPAQCGNYVACQKGNGQSKKCPPAANGAQLFFSQLSNECQLKKYCANDDDDTTNSGDQPPPAPAASKCTAKGLFISDEATCYGYFKCTDVGEVGNWFKCPPQTHFNPDTKECVTPYTYKCLKDRCGNMDAAFMGSVESGNCKNYLNCKSNTYIYASKDPSYLGTPCNKMNGNDLYFDEFLQQCVPNSPSSNPDYKLCPTVPAPPPKIIG